nr:Chain R, RbcL [synthetic construct]
EIKFEFD